jgi:hypothetical protein
VLSKASRNLTDRPETKNDNAGGDEQQVTGLDWKWSPGRAGSGAHPDPYLMDSEVLFSC